VNGPVPAREQFASLATALAQVWCPHSSPALGVSAGPGGSVNCMSGSSRRSSPQSSPPVPKSSPPFSGPVPTSSGPLALDQGYRCGSFRITLIPCGHPESARRHEIADEDIVHAYEHAIGWVRLGDDPPRYLLAGGDRAGNLLELVVIGLPDDPLVIHAMPLRKSTEQELFGDDQ